MQRVRAACEAAGYDVSQIMRDAGIPLEPDADQDAMSDSAGEAVWDEEEDDRVVGQGTAGRLFGARHGRLFGAGEQGGGWDRVRSVSAGRLPERRARWQQEESAPVRGEGQRGRGKGVAGGKWADRDGKARRGEERPTAGGENVWRQVQVWRQERQLAGGVAPDHVGGTAVGAASMASGDEEFGGGTGRREPRKVASWRRGDGRPEGSLRGNEADGLTDWLGGDGAARGGAVGGRSRQEEAEESASCLSGGGADGDRRASDASGGGADGGRFGQARGRGRAGLKGGRAGRLSGEGRRRRDEVFKGSWDAEGGPGGGGGSGRLRDDWGGLEDLVGEGGARGGSRHA